jgi:hypothetical protein
MFDNDVKLASIRIADSGRWIKLDGDSDGACKLSDILTLNFTPPLSLRETKRLHFILTSRTLLLYNNNNSNNNNNNNHKILQSGLSTSQGQSLFLKLIT